MHGYISLSLHELTDFYRKRKKEKKDMFTFYQTDLYVKIIVSRKGSLDISTTR